jgi:threonine dehydrogenase-like Zn-dependent dehydrogenase
MKVIQANKPGELRIVDRPEPTAPAADEAIVRIKAAGICGSDVHILHGKNHSPYTRAFWGMKPPAKSQRSVRQ